MVRWWKMKNDKLNGIFIEAVLGVDKAERVIFNSFPLSESAYFLSPLAQAQANRPQNDKPYYYPMLGFWTRKRGLSAN